MKNIIKNYFSDWSIYEKLWLSSFTIIILALSYYLGDSLVGVIASLTGIRCVILVAKGKISNYYFGIINVILYSYVAFGWKYYGEVMLNLGYFLPMQFIGLYMWRRNKLSKKNSDDVKVKYMKNSSKLIWTLISVIGIIGYGLFLQYIGGSLPFKNSITTVLSIVAMILMALRYVEHWVLWIIVDVVSIIMWLATLLEGGSDILILLMWSAYLVNAIYGLFNWIKLCEIQKV